METPICDFVRAYVEKNALRLHMPGHKGRGYLGMEMFDITEIAGADSLYEASGIIMRSELNAGKLFGCTTCYSTEGSSLCIRAMLYMAAVYANMIGKPARVLAGRNAHKSFLSAAALTDVDIDWLWPETQNSYLSCTVSADYLEATLSAMEEKPIAVYLTSPDYLGNMVDIGAVANVCHSHGVLLFVDNAHGAYLKFLDMSRHPMDLGADMCCDSAHKTLPVLTGGAYLHISKYAPSYFRTAAKNALAMFGSTSPSYLILQSLDAANRYIAGGYRQTLMEFTADVAALKREMTQRGYSLVGDEPIKLTIDAKRYGYLGTDIADALLKMDIVCEFADPDYVVCMLTNETGKSGLCRLAEALYSIPQRPPINDPPPRFYRAEKCMSIRRAAFSASETIPVEEACGRVLASATVGCPPAVPIVVCGERIDAHAIECFKYYAIKSANVVKQ